MNNRKTALALFAVDLTALIRPCAAAEFPIHDGERVVFLGDSITEQRLYTTVIEAYTLARFPEWKLAFRNIGWGGDTARGAGKSGRRRTSECDLRLTCPKEFPIPLDGPAETSVQVE